MIPTSAAALNIIKSMLSETDAAYIQVIDGRINKEISNNHLANTTSKVYHQMSLLVNDDKMDYEVIAGKSIKTYTDENDKNPSSFTGWYTDEEIKNNHIFFDRHAKARIEKRCLCVVSVKGLNLIYIYLPGGE